VNIRPDGSLDVAAEALGELDVVGAAIHGHFDQDRHAMTRRLVRAIEDPNVDILFHPTCRVLGRRAAIAFDFEEVLKAALRTGTILELDAQPARLDLPEAMLRRGVEAGAKIAIDSDAHTPDELRFVDAFGVPAARRGWIEKRHVVNALPAGSMLASLKRAHRTAA
jgi:DNA polymerase (family 10)